MNSKMNLDKYLGMKVIVNGKEETIVAYDDNPKCNLKFAVTSDVNQGYCLSESRFATKHHPDYDLEEYFDWVSDDKIVIVSYQD